MTIFVVGVILEIVLRISCEFKSLYDSYSWLVNWSGKYFKKGENVIILDQNNTQLARGLSSFSSTEIDKIKGKQSKEIEIILGYLSKTEVIHKDDMVLL